MAAAAVEAAAEAEAARDRGWGRRRRAAGGGGGDAADGAGGGDAADGAGSRPQPRPAAEEERLRAKYGAIEDAGERAYQILLDLGMVDVHPDPDTVAGSALDWDADEDAFM